MTEGRTPTTATLGVWIAIGIAIGAALDLAVGLAQARLAGRR